MSEPTTTMFGIHGHSIGLRQERLKLLASNLANVDTPGYKARDLDFQTQLRRAIGEAAPGAPARTQPGHLGATTEPGLDGLVYRLPLQPSLDGNTVDAEYEQATFARAALEYRASLNFIDGRVRRLLTAITGS
ncbi:MAG: flagellar basal body rod protein FlgB [Aquimonas sp.]|nr:flagellar basal body rod protein FlgB [Aquimonas sp.]